MKKTPRFLFVASSRKPALRPSWVRCLLLGLCAPLGVTGAAEAPRISETGDIIRVEADAYRWEWSKTSDAFQIFDAEGRLVVKGGLQPEIVVKLPDRPAHSAAGRIGGHKLAKDSMVVTYTAVNGTASARLTLRFDPTAIWLEPVRYDGPASEDVVELRYFSVQRRPQLTSTLAVIPGLSDYAGISPIVAARVRLDATNWLGRGGPPHLGLHQQWGLPVHFFCGFENASDHPVSNSLGTALSDAFCLGLADLPAGDLLVRTNSGNHSLIVSTRSDLWHHLRGPGTLTLGATLVVTFGADFRASIRAYYTKLVETGTIQIPTRSPRKQSVLTTSQFNTWGDQVMSHTYGQKLNEEHLTRLYDAMRHSGMRPGMFVIDDKWEGRYGNLSHDSDRFPNFEAFLGRVRQDGLRVGLWAAFMRCEDPADLGLTSEHMLRGVDDRPIRMHGSYYLLDFTQPEVQRVLRERAKRFVRRYRPDLVKFDFGYEIPSLSRAAPRDMNFAGERMLLKGLQIVVEAMRVEDPDIALMYYSLSPLFMKYIDLHSVDDLICHPGEYGIEANRRYYFSSLLAEIGMPTYGSGGYDWESIPAIWFDSALLGSIGSLQSLGADELGGTPTPERIAKFNGLAQLSRPATQFRIDVLGGRPAFAPIRAAHATSWARYEAGELAGVALRDRVWPAAGIEATAPVVIASRGSKGLHQASRLALVPYGDGELQLKRSVSSRPVEVRLHLADGTKESGRATLADGSLRLAFRERTDRGALVEWIEIVFDRD